eukprot:TRINITY_DN327_c0_g1_i1.p1 TRINITY_DN327_c0_g1~~TRINITY_DN327_c0_g1_i1.p1  ORF type:complete len:359 (+),score=74.73 TRINITY_DN327_c0_g1_i1:38-1078(+)
MAAYKEAPGPRDLLTDSTAAGQQVQEKTDTYTAFFKEEKGGSVEARKGQYTTMVNHFYDLITDFYEYGWGASFHFAPMNQDESFDVSLARYECQLADLIGLERGMKCLDIGCGVAGPMRQIARFSEACITGVNNNEYQIRRGKARIQEAGLSHLCSFWKGDYMRMPFEDESYDAAFAMEATPHAPDKTALFTEIYRILKPGAKLAIAEWCITDAYDARNEEHRRVKHGIEAGNALPDLPPISEVRDAFKKSGFEILEAKDWADKGSLPWYTPLAASYSLRNFRFTRAGRMCTQGLVSALETIRLLPRGSAETHAWLCDAATMLVQGGQLGIFSPMVMFVVRKPENK